MDGLTKKTCSQCGLEKERSDFYKNKSNNDGLHYLCIACFKDETRKINQKPEVKKKKAARMRELRRENPAYQARQLECNRQHRREPEVKEKIAERQREYRNRPDIKKRCIERARKRKYNLTPSEYDKMFIEQNGTCYMCGITFTDNETPAVDHDHSCCPSGKSCGKCIRGLAHNNCNIIEGKKGITPEMLRGLADHLERMAA